MKDWLREMKTVFLVPALLTLLVIALIFFTGFQNAGNTGTATIAQVVNYSAGGISQIFRNVGQSSHYLTYCLTGYQGSVDLEASFDGTTNWVPLASATYTDPTTGCNVLQAGGYYQNIRSVRGACVVPCAISASYSASSGPVSFAPTGLSGLGQTAPAVCNRTKILSVANAAVGHLTATNAFFSAVRIYVCAVSISFDGATVAGSVLWQGSPDGCTTLIPLWQIDTTATTPQIIQQSGNPLFPTEAEPTSVSVCVANNSGATAEISFSYTVY